MNLLIVIVKIVSGSVVSTGELPGYVNRFDFFPRFFFEFFSYFIFYYLYS